MGKLEAALPGIQYGRIYTWYSHQSRNKCLKRTKRNYDGMRILEKNARIELHWWKENLETFNIIDKNVLPHAAIFSDAGLTGWGATYDKPSCDK